MLAINIYHKISFSNQMHVTKGWPMPSGFSKLLLSRKLIIIIMCTCVIAPRLLLTSGVMCCDTDPIWLVKQVL